MLNLVCRSSEQRQSVMSTLKSVFSRVSSAKLKEDVNETVYCFPSTSLSDATSDSSARTAAALVPVPAAVERLTSKLENLKWL